MKVETRKRRFLYHIIYKYMSNSFKLNPKKNHIKKKNLISGQVVIIYYPMSITIFTGLRVIHAYLMLKTFSLIQHEISYK